jgi:hypothetical protein
MGERRNSNHLGMAGNNVMMSSPRGYGSGIPNQNSMSSGSIGADFHDRRMKAVNQYVPVRGMGSGVGVKDALLFHGDDGFKERLQRNGMIEEEAAPVDVLGVKKRDLSGFA